MKFSLRQLQVFHQVAELGSVSEAAKVLNMSQSAASMALGQLESMLDKPLFKRQGRQMALNHWGHWLRPHVLQVLGQCRTIELGMSSMDLVSGRLSLGVSQTPADFIMPRLLAELDRDFPQLEIHMGVANTEHVIAGLVDYHFDLGVIEGHCDDERIEQSTLCSDELVLVAASDHPYAQQERTSLAQLEMAHWVLRERGAGTREIFDLCIHEHITQIRVHREYDHVGVILALLQEGPYLSCLSRRAVASAVEAGQLTILSVPELNMKREFRFIWRKQDNGEEIRSLVQTTARHVVGH